jgi:hypothetical protein
MLHVAFDGIKKCRNGWAFVEFWNGEQGFLAFESHLGDTKDVVRNGYIEGCRTALTKSFPLETLYDVVDSLVSTCNHKIR